MILKLIDSTGEVIGIHQVVCFTPPNEFKLLSGHTYTLENDSSAEVWTDDIRTRIWPLTPIEPIQ
jgi:hypothetical protein